jgi:IclR family acetate operon transcriptional repressor
MKQHSNSPVLPGTQSVLRAIAVLKTLGRSGSSYGITELGDATGLSKATVFRLLGALENEGMVARDESSGAYRLGPEVITLGASAQCAAELRVIAHDELVRLARETGETATLEVLLAGEVLILDEVKGRFLLCSTPEIGRRWPAHATSTGKVLLALTTPVPPTPRLTKLGPKSITTRETFERELSRIRKQGYACAIDELEPGLVALAAPVRNHAGFVVASISLNGPALRLDAKRRRTMVLELCQGADRISRRMGATAVMLRNGGSHAEIDRRQHA